MTAATSKSVSDILAEAWSQVEKANLPAEIHSAAFHEAVQLLSTAEVEGRPTPARSTSMKRLPSRGSAPTATQVPPAGADNSTSLKKFASESGISVQLLEQVYYFSDGLPTLAVPARKLGTSEAIQTQTVATLLAAAHYFVLDEQEIPLDTIRSQCKLLRCYDDKHFTRHLETVSGATYTGVAGSKVVRARGADIGDALLAAVNAALGLKA